MRNLTDKKDIALLEADGVISEEEVRLFSNEQLNVWHKLYIVSKDYIKFIFSSLDKENNSIETLAMVPVSKIPTLIKYYNYIDSRIYIGGELFSLTVKDVIKYEEAEISVLLKYPQLAKKLYFKDILVLDDILENKQHEKLIETLKGIFNSQCYPSHRLTEVVCALIKYIEASTLHFLIDNLMLLPINLTELVDALSGSKVAAIIIEKYYAQVKLTKECKDNHLERWKCKSKSSLEYTSYNSTISSGVESILISHEILLAEELAIFPDKQLRELELYARLVPDELSNLFKFIRENIDEGVQTLTKIQPEKIHLLVLVTKFVEAMSIGLLFFSSYINYLNSFDEKFYTIQEFMILNKYPFLTYLIEAEKLFELEDLLVKNGLIEENSNLTINITQQVEQLKNNEEKIRKLVASLCHSLISKDLVNLECLNINLDNQSEDSEAVYREVAEAAASEDLQKSYIFIIFAVLPHFLRGIILEEMKVYDELRDKAYSVLDMCEFTQMSSRGYGDSLSEDDFFDNDVLEESAIVTIVSEDENHNITINELLPIFINDLFGIITQMYYENEYEAVIKECCDYITNALKDKSDSIKQRLLNELILEVYKIPEKDIFIDDPNINKFIDILVAKVNCISLFPEGVYIKLDRNPEDFSENNPEAEPYYWRSRVSEEKREKEKKLVA